MNRFPFIISSLAFIGGIFLHYFLGLRSSYFLVPMIFSCLFGLSIHLFIHNKNSERLISIGILLFFFMLGNFLHALKVESKSYLPKKFNQVEKMVAVGTVQTIDLIKGNEISFYLQTDSIRIDNKYQLYKVLFLCKVKDDSSSLEKLYNRLIPGNIVRIEGTYQLGSESKNPGEFDYNNYLHSKGISGLLHIRDEYDVKVIDWSSNFMQTGIFNARKYVDSKIISLHNTRSAGLLRGLLLADRSKIDFETRTEFVNSGVMHILAVSGLHVGYILLIFIFTLGRFNIIARSILTGVGLLLFLLLTGMPASVFRAVSMAIVIILAYISNRTTNIFNSLAIAAFIVLIFDPEELFNPGFQLSFLAVLSIAVIYPIIRKYIYSLGLKSKIIKSLLLFMGVSLSAQIGTLPLTFIYFGKLSLVALLTNIVVIPLAGIIVGIAIFTLVLSLVITPFASVYATVNDFLIFGLYKLVFFAGNFQFSFIPIKNFSIYDAIIFYLAVVVILVGLSKLTSIHGKVLFLILLCINAVLFSSIDNQELFEKGKLNVMSVAVSRGNATLIQFPDGQTAIINGGYASFYFDSGDRIIRPLLKHLDFETIDFAFITGMEQDNYGGLISLIKDELVKNLIKPRLNSNSLTDLKFEEFLRERNIPFKNFEKEVLNIDGVRVYSLVGDRDSSSLLPNTEHVELLKIMDNNASFLFHGGIKDEMGEDYSSPYIEFLKSDVLYLTGLKKINQSTLMFIEKVNPKICLVSFENQNKLEYSSVMNFELINKLCPAVHQIQEEGAIVLQSDGNRITKVNWK